MQKQSPAQIPFIDLKSQYLALKKDIDAKVMQVLESGAYINGPEVKELESQLAKYVGCDYALTCASGTDALIIPMMALGIQPGDEVITTPFSFIATVETIMLLGAKPVFVDIERDTFNLDTNALEAAITSKTKGIIPVSLYGQTCDMEKLNAIAQKHQLWVLEDAAQSFGATFKGKKSGNLSTVAATSFYPAKPLGCYGDGGAIFLNDEKTYKIMKEIREHGSESRYFHTRLGINGRLDTIQCAILISKLSRFDWELEQRNKIATRFNEAFAKLQSKGVQIPIVKSQRTSAWAQYTLAVDNREKLQQRLTDVGIPTSIHYPRTIPDQPWYAEHAPAAPAAIPHARWAANSVISLPLYPDMTEDVQKRIIEGVLSVF